MLMDVTDSCERQATLFARMCSMESPSLTVEPGNVLNTVCPGRSPSWILPTELKTPMRATTGGVQIPAVLEVFLLVLANKKKTPCPQHAPGWAGWAVGWADCANLVWKLRLVPEVVVVVPKEGASSWAVGVACLAQDVVVGASQSASLRDAGCRAPIIGGAEHPTSPFGSVRPSVDAGFLSGTCVAELGRRSGQPVEVPQVQQLECLEQPVEPP